MAALYFPAAGLALLVGPLLVLVLSSCMIKDTSDPGSGADFPIPWDQARRSIYQYVRSHIVDGRIGLGAAGDSLPDDEIVERRMGGNFVPGGADGGFLRHGNGGNDQRTAQAVFSALSSVLSDPSQGNMRRFYRLLQNSNVVDFIAPLDAMLADDQGRPIVPAEALHSLSKLLIANAPDREPVKFGIAMQALVQEPEDREFLFVLGRHEEFTLYCAEVLDFTSEMPEQDLWELAKHVTGWGRIETVQRLAGTKDPAIKEWLLREGFRNSIMVEYLAYTAATADDLLGALKQDEPDDELIKRAGEIISALITGGPAEGIKDYRDGAEATELYLGLIRRRPATDDEYLVLGSIGRHLNEDGVDWTSQLTNGWTSERRARISAIVDELLARTD